MTQNNKDTWADYSKLVLKELERLDEQFIKYKDDNDEKVNLISDKLTQIKNIEKNIDTHTTWIDKVNEVWSPTQMREVKNEVYKQKNKWVATIAVLTFIQVMVGILIALWANIR